MQCQKRQNDFCRFQGKPFNIMVILVYAPTRNAEEAKVQRLYEDLEDLLEFKPKKDVLFITGDWNAKVGSQETPGEIGKFGLGVQNEEGQRLIDFCQENALVIANTLFQQHMRTLYTRTSKDGQYQNQMDYTLSLHDALPICVFYEQNSISLSPASFRIPRPNLPVTPGVS